MICPTCKSEVTKKEPGVWPFCSDRCKLVDLGNWAAEEYRVPSTPIPEGMTAEELQEVLREQNPNGSASGHKQSSKK